MTTPKPRTDLPGGGTTSEIDPKTGLPFENPPAADVVPPGGAPGDDKGQHGKPGEPTAGRRRPDADVKQDERKRLIEKARQERERLVAAQDAEHPAVAEMERTAEAEMRGEIKHPGDPGYVPPPTPKEGETAPAAADPATTTSAEPAQKTPAAALEGLDTTAEFTTVKVYGVERQVPTAAVIAAGGRDAYQRKLAAAERTENERVQREEAERRRLDEENRRRAERTAPPAATVTSPPNPGASADLKAKAKDLLDRLYSGDTDKASAALEEIMAGQRASAPTLTPEEVADQVMRKLEQRDADKANRGAAVQTEAARVSANVMFKTAYPELAQDESKTLYAQQLLKRLVADPANAGVPLEKLVVKASDQAMTDFGLKRAQPAGGDPPPALAAELDKRDQAKRLGPFQETPAARAPAPVTEDRPRTRAEVVAAARKARGQPEL